MPSPKLRRQIHYGKLSVAERKLMRSARAGILVDLHVGGSEPDVAQGATWGAERTVRASVLAELLTSQWAHENGRLRAVRLRGARITGRLDLEAAELYCPLLLRDCY